MQTKWLETFLEQKMSREASRDYQLASSETKVLVTSLLKGDRFLTAGGLIAEVTGHKTKNNVQIKLLGTGELDWISVVAKVFRAA